METITTLSDQQSKSLYQENPFLCGQVLLIITLKYTNDVLAGVSIFQHLNLLTTVGKTLEIVFQSKTTPQILMSGCPSDA